MKKLALFLLLILAGARTHKAFTPTTYHVATTGSDSNLGTSGSPWLTLQHADNVSTCGDTIVVHGGTYNGQLRMKDRCTSYALGVGKTWTNLTGEVVTQTNTGGPSFHGDAIWDQVSIAFPAHDTAYYTFIGVDAYSWILDAYDSTGCIGGVYVDRVRLFNMECKNSVESDGINMHGAYWEFWSVKVHDNGNFPGQNYVGYGYYLESGNCLIDHGEIYNNKGYGIQISDTGSVVDSFNTVRYAIIHDNNLKATGDPLIGNGSGGMVMTAGTGNAAIGNVFYNNGQTSIQIGTGCYRCIAEGNTEYGGRTGISISPGGNGGHTVKNNIVYGNESVDIEDLTAGDPHSESSVLSNNLTTNPFFLDAAAHDFRLTASSTGAIGQGANLSAVYTVDLLNNAFTVPYEIGAYVYNGAACVPDHLGFFAQPSNALLGASLGTVSVEILTSGGVRCGTATNTITLAKQGSATWGTLASASNLVLAATAGLSSWNDLSVTTTAGSGKIRATAGALTLADSSSITISNPGCTPDHLTFTSQPANALLGASLGTLSVGVYNSSNQLCTSAADTVTFSKHSGLCVGMTIGGTTSGAATAGMFSSTDLNLTARTGSCAIDAAASGITGATSNTVLIIELESLANGFTVNASASSSGVGAGALGRLRIRTR